MRVVVAPDKFAGTLSAVEAAAAIRAGWALTRPGDDTLPHPMSDGGPGFLAVLAAALDGDVNEVATTDPLGRPLTAQVLVTGTGATRTAYVESALAVGLHLLDADERDPERTTSAGLADLLVAAVASGAGRIVVGLGGSATNDGGRGLLEALPAAVVERVRGLDLVMASDVANPLLGPNGATAVFGPQKGADREAVARLEGRMQRWVAERDEVKAVAAEPGAGAAGGVGAALLSLGARREPGAEVVARVTRLAEALATADLVVTGEGAYDVTSLRGKVAGTVAAEAQAAAIPCAVIAGRIDVGVREAAAHGVDEMLALTDVAGSPEAAVEDAYGWTVRTAERLALRWGRG